MVGAWLLSNAASRLPALAFAATALAETDWPAVIEEAAAGSARAGRRAAASTIHPAYCAEKSRPDGPDEGANPDKIPPGTAVMRAATAAGPAWTAATMPMTAPMPAAGSALAIPGDAVAEAEAVAAEPADGTAIRATGLCAPAVSVAPSAAARPAACPGTAWSLLRAAGTLEVGVRCGCIPARRPGFDDTGWPADEGFRAAAPTFAGEPSPESALADPVPPVAIAAPTPSATARTPTRPTQALARMISKC
ncbi:MAG: hypothetical protein KDB71_08875 [Mycobacterium sp.]|nr:hypothetical protein [Mycobacterium sp.]